MTNLHFHPPATMLGVHHRLRWALPAVAGVFALLAIGAVAGALAWDEPLMQAVVAARSPTRDELARQISRLGSTPVVMVVGVVAALAAARRCPRLALAIVILMVARPLTEFAIKELVGRARPEGHRLVRGRGPSYPSGHPYAAAASWGLLPPVIALYTRRPGIWWATVVAAWGTITAIAVSRIWLGVHWASDAIGGVLLACLGVAAAELLIGRLHRQGRCRAHDSPSTELRERSSASSGHGHLDPPHPHQH